jgi:hypothetical protein
MERYHKIKTKSVFGAAWGGLYRKEFLEKHQLLFDDNQVVFLEDVLFNLKTFSHQPDYYMLCEPVYFYLIRDGSIMNRKQINLAAKLLNCNREYSRYLIEKGTYSENEDLLIQQTARYFCWAVSEIAEGAQHKFSDTKKVIIEFGKDEMISFNLSKKNVVRHLKQLENKADVVFYSICMFGLKYKWYVLLTALFVGINPIMKRYRGKKSRA